MDIRPENPDRSGGRGHRAEGHVRQQHTSHTHPARCSCKSRAGSSGKREAGDVIRQWRTGRKLVQILRSAGGLAGPHAPAQTRGVDYTIYAKERKVPPTAAALFTEMEGRVSRVHQVAGMVDPIIGKDNSRWQPQKVCDSWQTEDNLTLMRSEFSPRYIARETTWTERRA
jgi:hypothetical protein